MTRRVQETMAEAQEGARSFARVIEMIADGDMNLELSTELHALLKVLADDASKRDATSKGSITLKLSLAVDEKGMVAIGYQLSTKEPEAKRSSGVLFLTAGNNLQVENPRQARLPLREVKKEETRDVAPSDDGSVREVR